MDTLRSDRRILGIALGLWASVAFVILTQVFFASERRSVTFLYHDAAHAFWARTTIYQGPSGFNYLPQFAILYTSFAWMSPVPQAIVWRIVSLGLYLGSLVGLARAQNCETPRRMTALLLLVALPPAISSFQSGQANLVLSAVMTLAIVALGSARWNLAAVLLVGAVMIKPLAIVMLLLAAAGYRALVVPLATALAAALLLPFLCADAPYAAQIYEDCYRNLGVALPASGRIFSDLFGIFRVLGIFPSSQVMLAIRLLAGVATLGLWWWAGSRLSGPRRAEYLHCLAAAYLMLFNPMNEVNSYVILAPCVAVLAARRLSRAARDLSGWSFALLAIALGSDNYGSALFHATNYWLAPTLTILFVGYLVWEAFPRAKPVNSVAPLVRRERGLPMAAR